MNIKNIKREAFEFTGKKSESALCPHCNKELKRFHLSLAEEKRKQRFFTLIPKTKMWFFSCAECSKIVGVSPCRSVSLFQYIN